jgi:hypothetical protein
MTHDMSRRRLLATGAAGAAVAGAAALSPLSKAEAATARPAGTGAVKPTIVLVHGGYAEVPYEWLDVWLSPRLDNALLRMNVQPPAAERGLVTPMFPWGSMATTRGQNLAYLTTRPAPTAPGGGKLYEVGVTGHGPAGDDLAAQAAAEIRTWDTGYRDRSVGFGLPDTPRRPPTPTPAGSSLTAPATPSPSPCGSPAPPPFSGAPKTIAEVSAIQRSPDDEDPHRAAMTASTATMAPELIRVTRYTAYRPAAAITRTR